jgi:hypothetical protein
MIDETDEDRAITARVMRDPKAYTQSGVGATMGMKESPLRKEYRAAIDRAHLMLMSATDARFCSQTFHNAAQEYLDATIRRHAHSGMPLDESERGNLVKILAHRALGKLTREARDGEPFKLFSSKLGIGMYDPHIISRDNRISLGCEHAVYRLRQKLFASKEELLLEDRAIDHYCDPRTDWFEQTYTRAKRGFESISRILEAHDSALAIEKSEFIAEELYSAVRARVMQ